MKCVILALFLTPAAMAASIMLTMDEVPNQLIGGLVVGKGGIDFTFSSTIPTLRYDILSGLGAKTYVTDPIIEGNNSAFGVAFSVPVYDVQFGFVVSSPTPIATMATVDLFNNSLVPFATIPLGSSLTDPFAEGQFNYSGPLPVTGIFITPTGDGFTAMGFDNLAVNATAEPVNLVLTSIGLAAFAILLRRRQLWSPK